MKPNNWQPITLPSLAETRNFITSDIDFVAAQEMWNKSTGLRGLLTARRVGSAPMRRPQGESDYVYDTVKEKYINVKTGRAVTENQLRIAVMRFSAEARERLREQTRQLIAGTIMFIVWYSRSKDILLSLYKTIWALAFGGYLFDSQTMRDLFYATLLMQFQRFDEVALAMDNGKQPIDGTLLTRVGSYGIYGNSLHQNVKLDSAMMKGETQARRLLGPNEDHCTDSVLKPGCVELAKLGWVPIRELVPLGGATCRANCLCVIETRKGVYK